MTSKHTAWSAEEVDRLKAMIASSASTQRASVALRRSLSMIKMKARHIGLPFPSEYVLRAKRRSVFQNSVVAP